MIPAKEVTLKESTLKAGDAAPDFSLPDQNGEAISLQSLRGKKVLLSFHPLAWTGVCEIQMRTLEVKAEALEKLNTRAFGVSVDSVPAKKAWADSLGMEKTALLSDFWPHGEVAEKYAIFLENKGISGRANILIDEGGKIELVKNYRISEVPDIEEIIRFIQGPE